MANQVNKGSKGRLGLSSYRVTFISFMDRARKNSDLLSDENFCNMVRNQFYTWAKFELEHYPHEYQLLCNFLKENQENGSNL